MLALAKIDFENKKVLETSAYPIHAYPQPASQYDCQFEGVSHGKMTVSWRGVFYTAESFLMADDEVVSPHLCAGKQSSYLKHVELAS